MSYFKPLPPLEVLKDRFVYDPETGIFCSKYCDGVVGWVSKKGYVVLSYDSYGDLRANRVAWVFITGKDPGQFIVDHRDRDRSNNRASNLRLATQAQNGSNRKLGKGWVKSGNLYQAVIYHRGVRLALGSYETPEEAREVYINKVLDLRGEWSPT